MRWIWLTLLCVSAGAGPEPTATEAYDRESIRGWSVLVHPDYARTEPALRHDVLELLDDHLYRITRVVPKDAVAFLQTVTIWVDLESHWTRCMCYHVSEDWLASNGFNPEKAGDIEIGNARAFLEWTRDQPWMVLHELSHALHHQVYTYEHPGVKAAWQAMVDRGEYEKVGHISGASRRHYALTNPMEYFAETTEALYGTNDFHPYVRSELIEVDPDGAALVRRMWESLPDATTPPPSD